MKQKASGPTVESLQEAYRKLSQAITLYLDAEENFRKATSNQQMAEEIFDKAHTHLVNTLQWKKEGEQ